MGFRNRVAGHLGAVPQRPEPGFTQRWGAKPFRLELGLEGLDSIGILFGFDAVAKFCLSTFLRLLLKVSVENLR